MEKLIKVQSAFLAFTVRFNTQYFTIYLHSTRSAKKLNSYIMLDLTET